MLACRKCQKKLKANRHLLKLANLKKTIKRRNREHPDTPIHVLNVPCMDLCPKNGVTVCKPAEGSLHLSILRSKVEIDQLYSE